MAMELNQEPSDGTAAEPFFHQQMRLRLWLTICLVDLQASFAQSTKPLISHQEAEMAVSRVRHINDFDFDLSTSEQLPDKEELTETTFALVTYRAQVAGRLLNFPEPEKLDGVVCLGVPVALRHQYGPLSPIKSSVESMLVNFSNRHWCLCISATPNHRHMLGSHGIAHNASCLPCGSPSCSHTN